jgi:hypothetical protein
LEDAKEIEITDDERLIVSSFKYIQDLAKLLNKTQPRVLANYLAWRAARSGKFLQKLCPN